MTVEVEDIWVRLSDGVHYKDVPKYLVGRMSDSRLTLILECRNSMFYVAELNEMPCEKE
jgi:hypothetical protein